MSARRTLGVIVIVIVIVIAAAALAGCGSRCPEIAAAR